MKTLDLLRDLVRSRRAVAMTEFALALPIVLPAGAFGVEISTYAVTQLRLRQATITLADNASRVGVDTTLATQQIREVDINDVFQGFRLQTQGLNVTTFGRVTLSSLEVNADGGQWIHWQRCIGLRRGSGYDAGYREGTGASGTSFAGVTIAGTRRVVAPSRSAVMVVEVNFEYQPLLPGFFIGDRKLRTTSSFIVRDNRDLNAGTTNPSPAASVADCATDRV